MQVDLITIQITNKQAKQFVFTQFLDSIGFFDSKLSQLVIDTDKSGQIAHVSLKHSFDASELKFSYPIDMNGGQGL